MPESEWLITAALPAYLLRNRVNHTQMAERMNMSRKQIVMVMGRRARPGPKWIASFLDAFPDAKHCNMFRKAPPPPANRRRI